MKTYHYKLEDIFFGAVINKNVKRKCCLYKIYINGISYYREISNIQERIFEGDALYYDEVIIYSSLTEFAKQQEISILLKNSNLKLLDVVTCDDIKAVMQAAKAKKDLGELGYKQLNDNCRKAAEYICDLLGFNISTYPLTTYVDKNKADLNDVPIPARHLVVLRRNLANFLSIYLLFKEHIEIYKNGLEMDEILAKVLSISKIKFGPEFDYNCMSLQVFRNSFELKKKLFPNKGSILNDCKIYRMAMLRE